MFAGGAGECIGGAAGCDSAVYGGGRMMQPDNPGFVQNPVDRCVAAIGFTVGPAAPTNLPSAVSDNIFGAPSSIPGMGQADCRMPEHLRPIPGCCVTTDPVACNRTSQRSAGTRSSSSSSGLSPPMRRSSHWRVAGVASASLQPEAQLPPGGCDSLCTRQRVTVVQAASEFLHCGLPVDRVASQQFDPEFVTVVRAASRGRWVVEAENAVAIRVAHYSCALPTRRSSPDAIPSGLGPKP